MKVEIVDTDRGTGNCEGVSYRKGRDGEPTILDNVLKDGSDSRPTLYVLKVTGDLNMMAILPLGCSALDITNGFCKKHRVLPNCQWTNGLCTRIKILGRSVGQEEISKVLSLASKSI